MDVMKKWGTPFYEGPGGRQLVLLDGKTGKPVRLPVEQVGSLLSIPEETSRVIRAMENFDDLKTVVAR